MQGATLLVVADGSHDPSNVEIYLNKSCLFNIIEWSDTLEGIEKRLKGNRYSACLFFLSTHAQSTFDWMKKMVDLGFSAPIIVLASQVQQGHDQLAFEAGAADFLILEELTTANFVRAIRHSLARREMEKERMTRLRSEAENRSKSEFLAHLSHELRTPLSAILGFTELLMANTSNKENLSHLNIVHRNGKHLLGLLNDVLDLSKIEAGKLEMDIQAVYLAPLLADIYTLMNAYAHDKNLHFHIVAETPLPTIIYTDPTRLRQILLNLIGNAIKFTFLGNVELHVQLNDNNDHLHFSIKDTGIGIHPKDIKLIFRPFVQIQNDQLQIRRGTGLGLTISKQLTERLGGHISVVSTPNQGSEFSFSIQTGDIKKIPRHPLMLNFSTNAEPIDELPQFSGRVLIVDDLRDIRTLIGHYVTRCGLEVSYASNGAEAVALVESQASLGEPYHLVLMDIHMPTQDGLTATQNIRLKGYHCPIVALTAAHLGGDKERYLSSGFNNFISKPVDQRRIVDCLQQYCEINTEPRDLFSKSPTQRQRKKQNGSILVVEDAKDALDATCALLSLLGWKTEKALSGKQALELARSPDIKAALVDINLPDISGYELLSQLHAINPKLEMIISSGQPVDAFLVTAPIKAALLKPLSIETLMQAL